MLDARVRKAKSKEPTFFTPSRAKQAKRDGVKKSSETGKVTRKFYVREVELPKQAIWLGTDPRMPKEYTQGRKWHCPSCDVAPNKFHEKWCPRYLFESGLYTSTAYDDPAFLSRAGFDKQIFWGDGHPEMTEATRFDAEVFWKALGVDVVF